MLTLYKKEIREVWNLLAHQYNLSTQLKPTLSHPKVPCAMNTSYYILNQKQKRKKIIHDQCTLNIPSTWKCGIRTNFITVTKEIDIQSRFWRALWNLLWTEEQSHMVFKSSQISKSSEPYCTWYFSFPHCRPSWKSLLPLHNEFNLIKEVLSNCDWKKGEWLYLVDWGRERINLTFTNELDSKK